MDGDSGIGDKNKKESHTASWKVVLVKWVSSIIIGLIFLACLVHSKIALLAFSEAMNATNGLNETDRTRLFVMLQIIALVPHSIHFIRGIWCGMCRRDRKYPSKRHKWILATVLSLVESFGICLFIFCFPGLCKPSHTILLMNCVFVFPLFDNIRLLLTGPQPEDEETKYSKRISVKVYWTIAVTSEIIGIGGTVYLLKSIPVNKSWVPAAGVVCVSIPWIPSVQKYLVENSYSSAPSDNAHRPSAQTGNSQKCSPPTSEEKKVEQTAWKLTAWMSFVKLLSTFGFSMMIYFSDTLSPFPKGSSTVDIQMWADGWKDWRSGTNKELIYVVTHIAAGVVGYVVGYVACKTRSQLLGFFVPLVLATPLSVVLLTVFDSCRFFLLYPGDVNGKHECSVTEIFEITLPVCTFLLVFAQLLSTWWLLYRSQLLVMLREDQTEEEMKQLLESLKMINDRLADSEGLTFESHIFFDGAVRNGIPTDLAVQLVVVFKDTLGSSYQLEGSKKVLTPYGMSLEWKPYRNGIAKPYGKAMSFTIHLKDNFKVKNKKRWSQVMYMSFVLNLLEDDERKINHDFEEKSYILTTDGDVKFTPDNVESLLDLMTIDVDVGAVCARTHPLGSGPMVWYQKFEYAIGHWFQKAAEHVIGTVLCSPGCFSVYRCTAIKDVLTLYATNVEKAEQFLTKDMGEDRWLCTLMVQRGWRIEYCAASENKTHCPEEFDEFFKQRRRWIVSTLANLWLLIKDWGYIRKNNLRVSSLFLVYQVILLVATLIGPSSVILVVSGGLRYGSDLNPEATMALQLLLCTCFTVICLYASKKVQLYVAKYLTAFYAVIMMIVIVGTAVQIATDIHGDPESVHNFISDKIRISTTSVYLFSMAGIFVTAGVLHPGEITCLFHGLFYLLFLPSGYLILIIYSICNITDSSWGTRESNMQGISAASKSWQKSVKEFIQNTFFCSGKEKQDHNNGATETTTAQCSPDTQRNLDIKQHDELSMSCEVSCQTDTAPSGDNDCVKDWLGTDMEEEATLFRQNGFDNTSFICGMTESEIKQILPNAGTGKITALLIKIDKLGDYEIPTGVPDNIESWLKDLDLLQYKNSFVRNYITSKREMEILKGYTDKQIRRELEITKIGHIKRLKKGIDKLRKPTAAEEKRANVKKQLMEQNTDTDGDSNDFWKKLTEQCLVPRSTAFESDDHLRVKLKDLRNSWLAVFAMVNVLWLILISTLANKGELLSVFGSNPVGFIVIVLFGFVITAQFFAMIIHRLSTLMHFLGRAPYTCNSRYHSNWMFGKSNTSKQQPTTSSIESNEETTVKTTHF